MCYYNDAYGDGDGDNRNDNNHNSRINPQQAEDADDAPGGAPRNCFPYLMALLKMRLRTYPLPSLLGTHPSVMAKVSVRVWSAMTRYAMSMRSTSSLPTRPLGKTSAAAAAGQEKVSPVSASAGRGLDGVEQGGPQVRIVVAHLVLHD